ncbi:MAG: hypothetical protein IKU60_04315, partial [Clostridia bacterium]|nr:hypothetical protein [Clostridia bacterium]
HVAPIVNYPIKAVMWYQGESDSGRHVSYAEIFQRMIADWRELWGKEDLPFFYVQLARYSRDNYAPIRNAQLQTLKLPNTGMVVTLDTDEGTYKNIHPLGKDVIGERMALLADKIIYGKDIVASGPIFKNAEVKGNKIIVHFEEDTIGDGLCISNTYGATDTKLCEFEIADVTGSYVKANAVINSDNTITVSADSITNPKYVRYAYSAVPANPNLFNKNGLPASPFTNDNRIVSANSFSSRAYETVGGDKQKISFDLTPIKDNIDGVIGITAAENSISAWNSAGITIRFQYDGYMGYVNDTVFENTTLAYKAGETYAVEIIADFSSDTYSLYVDGKLLCDGAKFRWDSLDMSNLGRIMLRGGSGWAAGDFYAENVNISRVANISQDEPKSFMDCFDPMPIVGNLSSDCWGSDLVGPRDQSNGLEDRTMESYNYWDGGIIKDEKTNKYHMFTSRWDQSTGFNGWKKSVAVHSVSDSLYGPYVEQEGLLWPDNKSGAGHNVFPFKLRDGDPNGKYAIINSDNGRPGDIFVADSLDGPWKYCTSITSNMKGSGFNAINVAVFLRPDGKYQALARHGDVAIADNLKGPWTVVIDCLWDQVPGLPYTDSDGGHRLEDPTMWYSNGKYHIIVNHWNMRKAYYMTSDDGITNWKLHSGSAYEPDADFLRYTDGTINHWNKIERPYAYVENGELKAFTFAVVDTAKEKDYANDLHGSKVIVVPFNSKKLDKIIAEDTIYHKRDGIAPVADGNVQSWESEAEYNYGGNPYMNLQVNNSDASYGIMGENSVGGTSDDCKISYVKYDISDYDLNKVFKATLSVVYKERLVGASDEDSIQVTLAGNDWEEGDGSDILGKAAESGELTWSAKPEIIYDAEDVEATVAYSDVFDTTENYQIIDIDVTSLIKNVDKNSDTVAFALCNTVNGNRLAVYTKELGTAYSVQLNLFEEDSYEGDNTDYDRLHLILDTEGREESGKLKDKTNNDKSAWYNWVTDSDNVTVDNGLNFDGNVTATVTRNDCRANKLVIEFTPDGTPAYPDHGILDGEGKVLFAHRYATDDNRIHIGRGEINSNVRGDDYIKDKSEQSRLTNFVAEKLGAFSARVDRGTVRYYQGDRVRIVAENTYWDDSLKKLFTDSENYTESFADMQEGEEVYTVTYYILQDGYTFKVSDSLYKGNFNGFGGFLVSGGKSGAIVSYKEIKIYTDNAEPKVFCENFKIKSEGVEGSNVAVFVAKEGDILKEVYTEETTDDFEIAIPEGYEYATFMLLNDIDKLSPVIKSFGIDANSVFVSAVGQNVKAFLPVENRTESAVYTFQFKDNGSNDSGIIIGSDEAGLNSQSSNYFASGSIVILFSNGELYTRDADSKALRGAYTVGEEVDVQIEADIAANTYNLYINGELVAENVGFRKSATVLDTLCLVENKGGEAFEVYNFRVR